MGNIRVCTVEKADSLLLETQMDLDKVQATKMANGH